MHCKVIILFAFFSFHAVKAQSFLKVDTAVYLEWNEERRLTWEDYEVRKNPSSQSGSLALTTVFHSIRGGMKNGRPNFQVRVLYVKDKSWTTDDTNSRLLGHERLHFDLAELYGRKIRKQIDILGRREVSELKVYKANIDALLNEFKRKSLNYDKETEHGRILLEQEKWSKLVNIELIRLEKYK